MKQEIDDLVGLLDGAASNATSIEQLSATSKFGLAQAYAMQKMLIDKRLARGEELSGLKLGFTSKAKMQQMGVHELIWGRLTNAMVVVNNGELDFSKYIHPRAEPEIAFRLSKDLADMNISKPLECISGVAVAIEIIDSRYKNFKFKLEDVVADNCSSAAYVLGEWKEPETSVQNLAITMKQNNDVVQMGNSDAILGNPVESLLTGLRLAKEYRVPLKNGMVILAGAATPAVYFEQGDRIVVTAENLGQVQLSSY